jgi:hypothetical protein
MQVTLIELVNWLITLRSGVGVGVGRSSWRVEESCLFAPSGKCLLARALCSVTLSTVWTNRNYLVGVLYSEVVLYWVFYAFKKKSM